MLSDLKELRCLVEGKEKNRERKKKNDVKEEYKDHKGFLQEMNECRSSLRPGEI